MLILPQRISNKFNNLCLYFLVITTLIGPLVYLGFASLYHLVVLALFLIVLFKGVNTADYKTDIMAFLTLWLIEAVISVLWAPNKTMALLYVYYIFLIFAIGIIYHNFLTKDNFEIFAHFMVVLLFVCNLIAIWEMTTGNHISKDYLSDPDRLRLLKYVPGGFYNNPNDFATYIIQILPFSFMSISSKKTAVRLIAFFNLVASFITVCAAQSRTQMIIIVLMYVFFVCVSRKRKVIGYGVLLCVFAGLLYVVYPGFRSVITETIESVTNDALVSSALTEGASLNIRTNLLKNAAVILYDTYGFGIGAGCHRSVMPIYSGKYFNTSNVIVMHNLAAEIFVDYGVLVGIVFLVAIAKSCYRLFRIYKSNINSEIRMLAAMLSFSIGMFIFTGISSSSILQLTSIWMTFCYSSAFIKLFRSV